MFGYHYNDGFPLPLGPQNAYQNQHQHHHGFAMMAQNEENVPPFEQTTRHAPFVPHFPAGQFHGQADGNSNFFVPGDHQNNQQGNAPFPFQQYLPNGYSNHFNQYQYAHAQYPFFDGNALNYNTPIPPIGAHLPTEKPIKVQLVDAELWQTFDNLGNEMAVTNNGREIFPKLRYKVMDVNPCSNYKATLKLRRQLESKLEYKTGKWVAKKGNIDGVSLETAEISSEVKSGSLLMTEGIQFDNVKIYNIGNAKKKKSNEKQTENEKKCARRMLQVHSHCKYIPVLTLYKVNDESSIHPVGTYIFQETSFVVVTSYKSKDVNFKKCELNKYVRGDVQRKAKASLINTNHLALSPPSSTSSTPGTSSDQSMGSHSSSFSFNSSIST